MNSIPDSFAGRARGLRAGFVATLLAAALVGAGCGHHHHDRDYYGDIVVDNRTDLTTMEDVVSFQVSRFGEPFSGDILGGDLPPASARWLGEFPEDFYDATADLSGGDIVDWQDEYVGDERTTTFEVR